MEMSLPLMRSSRLRFTLIALRVRSRIIARCLESSAKIASAPFRVPD
jgi:hypothetical protein